jgi:hypothetical protein
MSIETYINPKKIESFVPTSGFIKIHEIVFTEAFGFLINCNVFSEDENAKFCKIGIKMPQGASFNIQEFNVGPYDLVFGNLDIDLKKPVPIIRGNKLEFFAKNEGIVPISFTVNTEIRFESF